MRPGIPAFDEEVFGPVAALVAAKDEEHAIHLANQSASASAPRSSPGTWRGARAGEGAS